MEFVSKGLMIQLSGDIAHHHLALGIMISRIISDNTGVIIVIAVHHQY